MIIRIIILYFFLILLEEVRHTNDVSFKDDDDEKEFSFSPLHMEHEI